MRLAQPELPDAAVRWLTRHSITVLRVCLGIVFLAFAIPKFQPGASPAENLARQTVNALTFHLVNGHAAVLLTAEMETFIGFTLITGWALRAGLAVMSVSMIGILSPLVLFTHQLFANGISLEAQYVFKDIVLVASGGVVAAVASGARLELEAPAAAPAPAAHAAPGPFGRSALSAAWHTSPAEASVWGPVPGTATAAAGARAATARRATAPRAGDRPAARTAARTVPRTAPRSPARAEPIPVAQQTLRITPMQTRTAEVRARQSRPSPEYTWRTEPDLTPSVSSEDLSYLNTAQSRVHDEDYDDRYDGRSNERSAAR